jgi:preprotein translocase subunit SecE
VAKRTTLSGQPATGTGRPLVAAPGRKPPSPFRFFVESRAELRKVTWPTRQEAGNLTIAVVGMTIFLAAFLGLIDGILDKIIAPLIGR